VTLHEDDLDLGLDLVRALVDATLPDLAALPLRLLEARGSSNALFRLGDDLLVRLPRQPGGSATIEKEARWLPQLARHLPVAVPEIVAVGPPQLGYPERWSVVRWIEGHTPAVVTGPAATHQPCADLAWDLAAVVTALRAIEVPRPAHEDPELRSYRGAALTTRDDQMLRDLQACRGIPDVELDLDGAAALWDQAMCLPQDEPTTSWCHGDLFAENLLQREGRLAAVLDFGELSVGDPTVDLIVAWEVLDHESRQLFRQAVGVDEPEWHRARAWALSLALMTLPYYWTTMPDRCESRLAIARAVLEDFQRVGS